MAKKRSATIPMSSIRERIRRLDEDILRLETKRSEMKVRRDELADLLLIAKPEANGHRGISSGDGPMVAILRVVAANPGIQPADIVAQLATTIKTKAKDPRKNLYQSILNLKNKKRLKSTDGGGLEVVAPISN